MAVSVAVPLSGSPARAVPAATGVHSPPQRSTAISHLRRLAHGSSQPTASIWIMIVERTCPPAVRQDVIPTTLECVNTLRSAHLEDELAPEMARLAHPMGVAGLGQAIERDLGRAYGARQKQRGDALQRLAGAPDPRPKRPYAAAIG